MHTESPPARAVRARAYAREGNVGSILSRPIHGWNFNLPSLKFRTADALLLLLLPLLLARIRATVAKVAVADMPIQILMRPKLDGSRGGKMRSNAIRTTICV